ncbi:MAG: HAD family hydrolase [bacterium]|nr:HAD family hydrolase [bacterium]
MNKFKNIIFDLDGTLIDSSDGVVAAVNYSLEMMNQPLQSPERIKEYIGYPLSKMYPDFTDAPVKELYRHFQIRAAETVVQATVALDGVHELLEELKSRGINLGIGTTKIKRHVDGILDKLGWHSLFSATVGGDEVRQVKPEPDVFLLALDRLKASPTETLIVGDTVNDVLAAKAIPLPVAGVNSPYGGNERLLASKPDYHLEKLGDLPGLIWSRG